MSRYTSTSFFAVILLFVNFLLVFSYSQRDYDVRKLNNENLLFTEDDALPQNELVFEFKRFQLVHNFRGRACVLFLSIAQFHRNLSKKSII